MAKNQWTDIEIFDCDVAGFRVAMALAMHSVANPGGGSKPTDRYGILKHCTGALRCGVDLPVTVDHSLVANCPMAKFLRHVLEVGHRPRPARSTVPIAAEPALG